MASPTSGNDAKSQILQAVNIVELIGQSVALKRRGRDYLGLCPFHQEKTPSFHVKPDRQFFYCFGCKANGNAIDFVMKRDRIEFIEALKLLADLTGVELPKFGGQKQNAGERQLLLDAHSAACSLFEKLLSSPEQGLIAREYLKKRGFTPDSIQRFQVGVALDSWDTLLKNPILRKFPPPLLAQAGLVKTRERGDGFYDTFRNRLMFPIRDEQGRVIAFGGRVMPGSEDPAKYLNSPETPLFSKSRCVFGLDLARQKIVESRTVAIVEGYTDTMMAHQFGVTNVVSILGTAMTEQHVNILRRFADRIVLMFDPDTAGDTAVNRAVELFLTQPIEIVIASIPGGKDPDEFLVEQGAAAFEGVIANAVDALTFKWKQLSRQFAASLGDLTGQQKAVQQYLDILASARGGGPIDPLRWGSALTRVSRLTDIPVDELNRRFKANKPVKRFATAQGSQAEEPKKEAPGYARPATAQDVAENRVLGILLVDPKRWSAVQTLVSLEEFTDPVRRTLAGVYWNHQRDEGEPVFNEFLTLLDESSKDLAVRLVAEAEELEDLDRSLQDSVKFLKDQAEMRKQQKLVATVQRTTHEKLSEDAEKALFAEFLKNNQTLNLRRLGPVKRSDS